MSRACLHRLEIGERKVDECNTSCLAVPFTSTIPTPMRVSLEPQKSNTKAYSNRCSGRGWLHAAGCARRAWHVGAVHGAPDRAIQSQGQVASRSPDQNNGRWLAH